MQHANDLAAALGREGSLTRLCIAGGGPPLCDKLRRLVLAATFIGLSVYAVGNQGSNASNHFSSSFRVNSTADDIDANPGDGVCATASGECTLRAAVLEANALHGPQIIILPAGEYQLTRSGCCENAGDSGDLDITDDTTIIGAGAELTGISPGETAFVDRIFDIRKGASVSISNLTVHNVFMSQIMPEDESCGGGIRNAGNLSLSHVVVKDNTFRRSGGGICNEATLYVQNSLVQNNLSAFNGEGGGLINESGASANLNRVTIYHNRSDTGPGGGVANFGALIIIDSLINSNSADAEPAGGGGGVYNGDVLGASVTIINSTIAGNFTDGFNGGGGITNDNEFSSQSAALTVVNSTIADNRTNGPSGGGLRTSTADKTSVINSIIANNQNGDCRVAVGSIPPFSLGHNIDGDRTCALAGPGDLSGVDPKLGPLQDNGGPTATFSLLPGSPAINSADPSECPATDQRGAPRPTNLRLLSNPQCDIGAYEYGAAVPDPGPPPRGDVDCDGAVTMLDVIFALHDLALGTGIPDCPGTADTNCDGKFDVADVIPMLQQVAGITVTPCSA